MANKSYDISGETSTEARILTHIPFCLPDVNQIFIFFWTNVCERANEMCELYLKHGILLDNSKYLSNSYR